jgi:DHA1 family multidrug resistance protein-like MFS transporter
MLLAFRFLTGFFSSPVLATGGASMADLWVPKKRAYAIGIWGVFATAGPVMGPMLGGFAVENETWKWSIWELIWLSGFCLVVLIFTLPETSGATILYRRAKRLRKATGKSTLKSAVEIEAQDAQIKDIVIASLWRPFQLCFQEPILIATNIYLGLVYSLLYTWFEAFPIVFGGIYNFDPGRSGLAFLGTLIGAWGVMIPYCAWLYFYQEPEFDADGNIPPEKRLPPAIAGSWCIPICMFWFGWTSRPSVHWIVPIIGSSFFSIGAVPLFNAILNYQSDAYPVYVGSVLAGNDLVRSGMGGAFPLFARAMFHRLGINWGCTLLGFFSIAFIPIPILLSMYGKRIRLRSQYARHDI